MSEPIVKALLTEREGYVRRGLTDRVAAVDEQLRLRGHTVKATESTESSAEPTAADKRAEEQPATEPPKRRGRPPKATTEQESKESG